MPNGELVSVEPDLSLADADTLLAIANKAESMILAVKKIKSVVFALTNSNDWVDENGKPYLQASGAEKIRPVFGIEWHIDHTPEIEEEASGHRTYKFHGTFKLAQKTISIIGMRSSKDPFFSRAHQADIPPEQIDMSDVEKSAFTNCIGNGVTRVLGIRNMTWEELAAAGIEKGKSGSVDRSGVVTAPKYGKFAGQPIPQVDDDWLKKYGDKCSEQINDHAKEKYKKSNQRILDAITQEVEKRQLNRELDQQAEAESQPA